MEGQLKKILDLSKKTGDRVIVYNENTPEDSFVVMSIEEYQKLMEKSPKNEVKDTLTEEEMLDKINSDMDSWNKPQETNQELEKSEEKEDNNWQIPSEIKQAASDLE